LNGKQVNAVGITLGFSVPVYRWYNSLAVSIDGRSKRKYWRQFD